MKQLSVWKNNGSKLKPHYDFILKNDLNDETVITELAKIAEKIESLDVEKITPPSDKWLDILRQIPKELKEILVFEIKNGNRIASIEKSGWPQVQSVVIKLIKSFHSQSRIITNSTQWRLLDDPHYCDEEISQVEDGTEHLLIA